MRTYLDCIPCFLKQALKAARLSSKDEILHKKIIDEVSIFLPKIKMKSTPPEIAREVYGIVAELTQNDNPFDGLKKKYTKIALESYDYLHSKIERADDPIEMGIRIAVAGNIIDFGALDGFDMKKEIEKALHKDFAVLDIDVFKEKLNKSKNVLYIGDNAGETVFDRIFIETLGKNIIYAVRDVPIINDAIIEDAEAAGLAKVAKIISSGSAAPGTILDETTDEFRKLFDAADIVIAKGMGNYESLFGTHRDIFFILRAKCKIVAHHLGCDFGDLVCEYYSQ
ncbi:MAG: damage-control phosphatase ARMT1 family protein [Candidatus Zixiibacteriota bacterium]